MDSNYSFNIENMTVEHVQKLIYCGDDSHDNQIRVTIDGIVFLSHITGATSLAGIKFRFDTFDAHHGYTGPKAAEDMYYINRLYNALKKNWQSGNRTYIDDWNI